jgi:hypothetical protein
VGEAYEGEDEGASSSLLCGNETIGDGDGGGAHMYGGVRRGTVIVLPVGEVYEGEGERAHHHSCCPCCVGMR